MRLKINYLLMISLFLFTFLGVSFAQEDTSKVFLVGPKFAKYIGLTDEQSPKVNPSLDSIRSILKTQQAKRDEMRAKFEGGERPSREEMQQMREEREKNIETIKDLIENIKKELTPEQLEKFKSVELPNLEMRPGGRRFNR